MDVAIEDLTEIVKWAITMIEPTAAELRNSAEFKIARHATERSPLAQLAKTFGLSCGAQRVLRLLVGVELDQELRLHAGALTLDRIRAHLIGSASSRAALDDLGPRGALRRFVLIERSEGGGPEVHESRQTWAIARRVLAWLHGDASIDPALAELAHIRDARAIGELAIAPETIAETRAAVYAKRAVVVVQGRPGLGRRTLLASVAREQGIDVIEIDGKRLDKQQIRAIARECKLLGRTPLVANADVHLEALGRELAPEIDGPILVSTQCATPRWQRPAIVVHLNSPTSAMRAKLWRAALPEGSEADADHLATQYPLAPALVHAAADAIHARATKITPADIDAGIRTVVEDRLAEFARRVEITQTWDDLVLRAEQLAAIGELVARIRQRRTVYEDWGFAAKVGRGLGTAALFSGPPGTGKTMAAGLVARELGLPLYQVDAAKITSKYIGETEQHLAALFDAAEAGHAILLFDEADSLFGKRTDVRTSNDRYANLETNYLLQRLESFTGICLLTTNHESVLDPAFQRRLAPHVRFELPDEHERAKLWRAMLPARAPTGAIDFDELARRFRLPGGHIRNAALRAAFLAADEGAAISEQHLAHAARVELEALGKLTV